MPLAVAPTEVVVLDFLFAPLSDLVVPFLLFFSLFFVLLLIGDGSKRVTSSRRRDDVRWPWSVALENMAEGDDSSVVVVVGGVDENCDCAWAILNFKI